MIWDKWDAPARTWVSLRGMHKANRITIIEQEPALQQDLLN